MLDPVKRHPVMVAMMCLGIVLTLLVFRTEDTRSDVGVVEERVVRVEASSPCVELNTRECALKLLASLSPEDRREFLRENVREEVVREINRIQRGRLRDRVQEADPGASGVNTAPVRPNPPTSTGPGASVPGRSPEGTSLPPSGEGGGAGSEPTAQAPSQRERDDSSAPAPAEPTPPAMDPIIGIDPDESILELPDVDVPPVGPVDLPPVKTPEVPCVITPVTKC